MERARNGPMIDETELHYRPRLRVRQTVAIQISVAMRPAAAPSRLYE
jgi:hypothetical protein